MENITVVLRTVGERTTQRCEEIVKKQACDVHTISISPLILAVKKTFEIAACSKNEWTLALDADVLLEEDAISRILDEAHHRLYNNSKMFRIDFLVQDKFRGRVYAGCHLYRSKYSNDVLSQMSFEYDPKNKRPESWTVSQFKKNNRLENKESKIRTVGLHDHEQYYVHLYNKYINRGFRDGKYYDEIKNSIVDKMTKNPEDKDYQFVLKGLDAGCASETMRTDSREYINVEDLLLELGIKEKDPL